MRGAGKHASCGRRRRFADVRVAAAIILSLGVADAASAQQPAAGIVAPGNAVVSGFSGTVPPAQIAPGVDPADLTEIDLSGPSLRVVDLQRMPGPPQAQLVGAPKLVTWFASQIGQVFAVALDDASPPNIYAAASSAYGLPIVVPGAGGGFARARVGTPNATFMPGLWGGGGGPGTIWKIDGVTGAVTLFADVTLDGRPNSGPALGGLAFDPVSHSLYVADRETGFIHRFDMKGTELGRYDHGSVGRAAQGLPPVTFDPAQRVDITSPKFDSAEPATWNYAAAERRVFGLGVFRGRLYYAVAARLQVWSVGLKPEGSFADDPVMELGVAPAASPTEISKITFDEQGQMYLAERPASTGAWDFEALARPGIGRVLRYRETTAASPSDRIWAPDDEYAIGFPAELRNGNGGVAIGYRYDASGRMYRLSCGGFLWSTGEDLRRSPDPALAERLAKSGELDVAGLQGEDTRRIGRKQPPLESYFAAYEDEVFDAAARGHMGDIAIVRPCAARLSGPLFLGGGAGAAGYPPLRPGRPPLPPTTPGCPPGAACPPPSPPGGCPPGETCPPCMPPSVMVGDKCCSPAGFLPGGACSTSGCAAGSTLVGGSCCPSTRVYAGASGAQACCSGQVVNGQCQGTPVPICAQGAGGPGCCAGYVAAGNSCCLASQMTSTGICCPSGQTPSGPGNSLCRNIPPIVIPPGGGQCCAPGTIPTRVAGCCALANVTTLGVCCPGPVDPNDRAHCPAQIQAVTQCAPGYTKMADGSCCNNRYLSADGKTCRTELRPCPPGEVRGPNGVCGPALRRAPALPRGCPPGEVRDRHGVCRPVRPTTCPTGEVRGRDGVCRPVRPSACPPGTVRTRRGNCVAVTPAVPGPGLEFPIVRPGPLPGALPGPLPPGPGPSGVPPLHPTPGLRR